MLGKFYKDDKGLKRYENEMHGILVYIEEIENGSWKFLFYPPMGSGAGFATFLEAFDAVEHECREIEREASERRSRCSWVATDSSEF